MAGAQPAVDPRLGADQDAGDQDQPRHHGLEDPGRQRQQQQRPGDGADGAGDQHDRGDRRVLAQLAPVAEGPAQPRRRHPDGVGRVGHDGRESDGEQHREAQQRRDPDGRGQDAGPEPRGEDRDLLPAGHFVGGSRSRATSLTRATWACIASEAASGSLRADGVGDRPVPGQRGARAVGLRQRLDPGLLDQVADLVHQPGEQERVGRRGDGAVEALVALHPAAAGLDVGLHRGERLVDAGAGPRRYDGRPPAPRSWSPGRRGCR